MSDLSTFREALESIGIPFEEKQFHVVTSITIPISERVMGDRDAFMDFTFKNEDETFHLGYLSKGHPEKKPESPASSTGDLAAEYRNRHRKKKFGAPPKKG